MESDSDSDASHVSATPPRNPEPNPPPPPLPSPKSRSRVFSLPKSRRSTPPKCKPKITPKPNPKSSNQETPEPSFPSADLLNPHGLSVKIQRPSDINRTASFSRLVKFRRPSFDPSEFENGENVGVCGGPAGNSAEEGGPPKDPRPSEIHAKLKRIHPNSIGFEVPVELPKRPRCSNEGNFVRLNINGYGRKYAYKNGRRRFATTSRGQRYRRKFMKHGSGNDAETYSCEEDKLASGSSWEQRKGSNCRNNSIDEAVVAAREDLSDENLKNLLKLTHGYDSFREGQLEAIKKVVAGESTMLVLPTGAGKSLCYQLPALILPGITLVVSPLVALMVDQLRKLPPVIPGGLLSSSQTHEEASETMDRLLGGDVKVLFVSPERFLNVDFLSIFEDALSISLAVIDEAHCISEWSHNFRPSYLRLRASLFQSKLNVKCLLAMTATATTQTLHDIMHALEIPPNNLIQACQIRENLQLVVILSDNRLKDLLVLMKSSPLIDMQSIIVYCKFQVETELVSKYLCDNNIPAKVYHSGIPTKNRSRVQELFCSNKLRVVVATVAFGMGLDKSDVQAVIHYSLPESLEEYIQETGRAGRDGRLSYCHLLLDVTTYYKLRSLSYSDGVDEYAISKFLSQIFSSGVPLSGNICSLVKESASRKFDMKEEVLLTVLTQLEIGDEQYLRLLPQLNVTCTLYFHKTAPALLSDKDIVVATILKISEIKEGHHVFDIPTLANTIGISTKDLFNQLQDLKSLGEITYNLKDPAFCYTVVKQPDDLCSLSTHLTKWLSEVESCKVLKLDAMFNVANFAVKECKRIVGCSESLHTKCIQEKVLDYFSGRHHTFTDDSSMKMKRSSPFLHADIKVFLQSNSYAKFTPRAVARIMHGIPSPAFPSATWSKSHFWGRYMEFDFPVVMEAAKMELLNFARKDLIKMAIKCL
ncbi:ATP-dependent DNA helicase Q-like 5 isoform X2 [Phoenix dactylifera]|uniref:DNA 3'-5' helicase n=1 Tax=Phoenix dactylifera TaxID=42345 RepID=A0A8B9AKF4_PHODC|nr:ATP-dependent DNA helicase Q-like 5 isoform X2 [Phoenix dactylifera]